MILMTQKIGQGPTRRCDARCYNAKGGKCTCICGGQNHCAGEAKALRNTQEIFAPLVFCKHGKLLGTCEQGCTKSVRDLLPGERREITRKALRELKRREEAHGSSAA